MSRTEKHSKMKEEKENKINDKLYFLFMLVLVSAFIAVLFIQYQNRLMYQREIDRLNVEIVEQQEKNSELKKQSENLKSDEYIEKMARERGYLKSNEIIFYEN